MQDALVLARAAGDEAVAAMVEQGQEVAARAEARRSAVEAEVAATLSGRGVDAPLREVEEHWSVAQGGDRWHAGGCGAFAIAMQERWPQLRLACEMYPDGAEESVAHAWAYDPATGTRFDIFGAHPWDPTERPDYSPDSTRVALDLSPDQVRGLFHRPESCSEEQVLDAMWVACEMFDPQYVAPEDDPDFDPEFDGDRSYLYF